MEDDSCECCWGEPTTTTGGLCEACQDAQCEIDWRCSCCWICHK